MEKPQTLPGRQGRFAKPKDDKANRVYFIRTNDENPTEGTLWQASNTIREVEATFQMPEVRLRKSDRDTTGRTRGLKHIYT